MKRLIIINILLVLALNILPKEMKVEAKVVANERKWSQSEQVTVQVTSRNLDSKRDEKNEEISVESNILQSKPTEISKEGIDFIKQYEGFIPVATRLTGEQYMTLGYRSLW